MPQRQKLTDEEILRTLRSGSEPWVILRLLRNLQLAFPAAAAAGHITYAYVERRLRELEDKRLVRRAGNSGSDRRRRLWVAV